MTLPKVDPEDAHRAEVAHLETLLMYQTGALEEIRREAREMKGGWRARVLLTLEIMLGPDPKAKRPQVCP